MEKENDSVDQNVHDLESDENEITHDISISQNRSIIKATLHETAVSKSDEDAKVITVLQNSIEMMIDLLAEARNELAYIGKGEEDEIMDDDKRFVLV